MKATETMSIEETDTILPVNARKWGIAEWGVLIVVIIVAIAARYVWYTGVALGDDILYIGQILSHVYGETWLPEATHRSTRVALTMPTAWLVRVIGPDTWVFVAIPWLCSLGIVVAGYVTLRRLFSWKDAAWGGLLLATFPLSVLYATQLFPDIPVGLFGSLAVLAWLRGLDDGRREWLLITGVLVSIGYLFRETIVMLTPVFLVLWVGRRPLRWEALIWAGIAPVLTVAAELAAYGALTGNAFYRWQAISNQQSNAGDLSLVFSSKAGGTVLTDPLFVLFGSHEFGVLMGTGVVCACVVLWKAEDRFRPFAWWLLVGLGWCFYGTTSPTSWRIMERDPRYACGLELPAVVVIVWALTRLYAKAPRLSISIFALLLLTSLLAPGLDRRGTPAQAHREWLARYPRSTAALEPFEFIAAWTLSDLRHAPSFSCLIGQGRSTQTSCMSRIQGIELVSLDQAEIVVYSPQRRPDLASIWNPTSAEAFDEDIPRFRQWIGQILQKFPSQKARASRMLEPAQLIQWAIRTSSDGMTPVDPLKAPERGEE